MADKRISIGPGIAVYPRLKTPDTKFDDLGVYKADIAVDVAQAQPLMDELSAVYKAHTGKAPKKADNPMWEFETDDAGEETGRVIFKAKVKNRLNKKGELWDRRPKLFDAALKPIDVNPYGGTEYVVSAEVYCWDFGGKKGVSLQPVGVQIINLVTGNGPDASSMGFSAQDGYVAPAEEGSEGLENRSGDNTPDADPDAPSDASDY